MITPAQRLTEIICDRIARDQGITLVPYFWNDKYWAKMFRLQIVYANRLIKEYSYEAIFRALNLHEARKVRSFAAKFFYPMVERMQKQIVQEAALVENSTIPVDHNVNEKPRGQIKNKNKSLREKLDG